MSSSAITGPILADNKRAPSGTAAAPSFAFNDSTGTGVYLVSAGVLGLSTAGVQRVVVDASGNVGIGTGSPAYKVDASLGNPSSSTFGLRLATGNIGNLILGMSQASTNMGTSSTSADIYTSAPLDLRFGTNSLERMRIDASGNLGIGTASPAVISNYKSLTMDSTSGTFSEYRQNGSLAFRVGSDGSLGGFINQTDANPIRFFTNTLERMRIDASGRLLVGTTTAQAKVTLLAGAEIGYYTNKSGAGGSHAEYWTDGSIYARLNNNGNWQNANTSYGGLSDAKLKENVVDATPKLEKLKQVRIVNFNLIGHQTKQIGVIAQELEQVFPGLVEENPDYDAEGKDLGTVTKSVKYSVFVPMLIKAMQEQQEIIEKLEARLAALESK